MANSTQSDIIKESVTAGDTGPMMQFILAPHAFCDKPAFEDLPPEWSHERDDMLRSTMREGLWASAVGEAISQAAEKSWAVKGPLAETVRQYHELFHAANTIGYNADGRAWGHGWQHYLNQHLTEYFTSGNGPFTEVVRKGLRVIGFVHLDSSRCLRTGDWEYPVEYTSLDGRQHLLGCQSVFYIADMPSPKSEDRGTGVCAAERAYDEIRSYYAAQRRYWERMDNRRTDKMHLIKGVGPSLVGQIVGAAEAKADEKRHFHYLGQTVTGIPGDGEIDHVEIDFGGMGDEYDREADFKMARARYALALDIDPQDIAPLDSGGRSGTVGQSLILDRKNRRSTGHGWDRKWMDAANQFLTETGVRFYFTEETDATERAAEAKAKRDTIERIKCSIDTGMITPDQGLQEAIREGIHPQEFMTQIDTGEGPFTLEREDPSDMLEEERPEIGELPQNVARPGMANGELEDDEVVEREETGRKWWRWGR